jgi:hypothetical protein
MLYKGRGGCAKPPHATLPCTMTRQGRVILSPFAYKYQEEEKKTRGVKRRGTI